MDQKERIIEQAMHMFVSQGIKSVRMDDIAQQLGVSKRTLYELFGDKEGLLYLAMDRYFEKKRIERAAVCAHARNVLEAMFMVLGGVMDNAEVIQRLLNNLRKFYPAVHDKMTREGTAKSRRDLQDMLEKGIADGLFVVRAEHLILVRVVAAAQQQQARYDCYYFTHKVHFCRFGYR